MTHKPHLPTIEQIMAGRDPYEKTFRVSHLGVMQLEFEI